MTPTSEEGRRFAELATVHGRSAAERAEEHDRDGTFPHETITEMRQSGFLGALIPEELGGMGVSSVHDWAVGMNRLGRGDGSTAIAVNMHLGSTFGLVRMRAGMARHGNDGVTEFFDRVLRRRVRDQVVCAPLTERGTTLLHPMLQATRRAGGWTLTGRKVFGTLSPAADLFSVTAVVDENGMRTTAVCSVPRGAPGMTVVENWDALGMRASGSNDILFEDCEVPDEAVVLTHPWGTMPDMVLISVMAQVSGLLGGLVGIAESARDDAYAVVTSRTKLPSGGTLAASLPGVQRHAATIEIDLSICRSMLDRVTSLIDSYLDSHPMGDERREELEDLFVEFQAAKFTINQKAIDVVDNAMTMTGGAGYMNASRLSRLYRDVRAGPFMQSYSPNEVMEYIGPTALGIHPASDL